MMITIMITEHIQGARKEGREKERWGWNERQLLDESWQVVDDLSERMNKEMRRKFSTRRRRDAHASVLGPILRRHAIVPLDERHRNRSRAVRRLAGRGR